MQILLSINNISKYYVFTVTSISYMAAARIQVRNGTRRRDYAKL